MLLDRGHGRLCRQHTQRAHAVADDQRDGGKDEQQNPESAAADPLPKATSPGVPAPEVSAAGAGGIFKNRRQQLSYRAL
jgi:hypothetical protein